MTKQGFLLVATTLALGSGLASAKGVTWKIDSAHSAAHFSVKHLMVSNVHGTFSAVSGEVVIDEEDPTKSTATATIGVESVDTGIEKRDEHLRGPDFFDVKQFPNATWQSVRVIPGKDKEHFQMVGKLTLHGVTKVVVLETEVTGEAKNPFGPPIRGATATATISRKDLGLVWNKAIEGGGVVISDDVKLTIELELQKQ